ncbi:MAG: hypothetical protein ACI8VW_001652 [bacterium]|jgi:hypothetical protein
MVLWNWDKRTMIGTEETRLAAEEIFDEMLEAEEKLDYQSFVKRFGKKDIDNFGESRFTKDRCAIRTDLGVYKSREFLGALNGLVHTDNASMHPGCIRFVWRGVFKKNETLIVVGVHKKDERFYANSFMYHY